jgi:hypothetical protein
LSGPGQIIGDIAAGALTARAVEPAHGEAGDGHTHEHACLNCGTALIGSHCHNCGQAAHVHKTISAFFHDLLHGVFHFEGKIWRTVPKLAFKPGQLTREYIDGRRASYVSPIALFLFAVFLTFAVVKNVGFNFGSNSDVEVNGKHIKGLEANRAEIAKLEKERATLKAQGKPVDAIDGEIEGRKSAIEGMEALNDPAKAIREQKAKEGGPNVEAFDSDVPAFKDVAREISDNPQLALFKLESNAYKFAWALIPISVPFVWLLFPFSRRFGVYDHTVFVTYSLCFMLLLISLLTGVRMLGVSGTAFGMLIPPVHIYKQVRYGYGLGRWGALWRTFALCSYAFVALLLFLVLIFALS